MGMKLGGAHHGPAPALHRLFGLFALGTLFYRPDTIAFLLYTTAANETMHTELDEGLRFGTLLAEISSRFVNVPADQVDGEIKNKGNRLLDCRGFFLFNVAIVCLQSRRNSHETDL
jgi:hypothetical protein